MKKTALTILAVLALSGCLCLPSGPEWKPPSEPVPENLTSDIQEDAVSQEALGYETKSLVRLDDYLSTTEPYLCNFTDLKSRCEIWARDGKYYAIIRTSGRQTRYVMSDLEWVYLWDKDQKMGIKYKIGELQGLTGEANSSKVAAAEEPSLYVDIAAIAGNSQGMDCRKTDFPETLLEPPSNIRFRTVKGHVVEEGF